MKLIKNNITFIKRIFQLIISSLIFLIFVLYVWLIQLNYDETSSMLKKALLFSLIIFGGSFSYDIIKTLAFMAEDKFWKFFKSLTNIAKITGVIISGITLCAIFYFFGMYTIMLIAYIVIVALTFLLAKNIYITIDIATTDEDNVFVCKDSQTS